MRRAAPFFVGDHPAVDFLNTRVVRSGVPTEWLSNGVELVDWLEQARAIERQAAKKARASGDRRALDRAAKEARELREWLRRFLKKHTQRTAGAGTAADLAPLNKVLASGNSYTRVTIAETGIDASARVHQKMQIRRVERDATPSWLLQPIAYAVADLLCHQDLSLVRVCDGSTCTLMFLDRTKAHVRRWCSMAVCGNRAKAAAYRARPPRSAG